MTVYLGLSISLSVLSVYLYVCMPACSSGNLCACPYGCLTVLYVCLSGCLSVCLYVYLSVNLSVSLSVCICLYICVSISLSVYLFVCLCVCVCVCWSSSYMYFYNIEPSHLVLPRTWCCIGFPRLHPVSYCQQLTRQTRSRLTYCPALLTR